MSASTSPTGEAQPSKPEMGKPPISNAIVRRMRWLLGSAGGVFLAIALWLGASLANVLLYEGCRCLQCQMMYVGYEVGNVARHTEKQVIAVTLLIAAAGTMLAACRWPRAWVRVIEALTPRDTFGLCKFCGYDRMGLRLGAPCPECGKRPP